MVLAFATTVVLVGADFAATIAAGGAAFGCTPAIRQAAPTKTAAVAPTTQFNCQIRIPPTTIPRNRPQI
jgi:hypothetical protein